MKHIVSRLVNVLGRERAWRLGRSLYLAARGEGTNELGDNSETRLMAIMAESWAAHGGGKTPVLLDIGANKGRWTTLAKAAFDRCGLVPECHLFEPSPSTMALLASTFGEDAATNLHPLALSNDDGEATFHITSPTGGRNSLVAHKGEATDVITVTVRRGAAYLEEQGIAHAALAKIDAEGHDAAVLEGLEPWLATRRVDCVQFEYSWRWLDSGKSMKDMIALAERHGYLLANVHRGEIEVIPAWNPELDRFFEWNYLLVSPTALERLPHRKMRWSVSNALIPA